MPWKALLRMGKLKPSPEAIDMFMSMGDGVIPRSKKTLLSEIFTNIFWGVTTPAQAMLMLNGCPPPNAKKELIRDFKREFVDTKMIEKKWIDFLDKVVNTWRDYEHEKIKEISGAEIDKLLKQTEEFLERLKKLREEIEKKSQGETIEELYKDLIELLKTFMKSKSQEKIIEEFDRDYVKKGKFTNQHLRILKNVIKAREEFKKGKSDSHKIDRARRDADILKRELIEFVQRKEMVSIENGKMILKFKDKTIEILNADYKTFLFDGMEIKKIDKKVVASSQEELEEALKKQEGKKEVQIDPKVFEVLKKEMGEFEIVL
jgi:uncharacterized protein (UPF0332 family)